MNETTTSVRVLVVEDNPYDVKIITELFRDIKSYGFTLTIAETLEKAAAYDESSTDVILLDLNLPDSYGPATLTSALTLFRKTPVIVMTGFYEEHLGIELIKKGAQDYLVKGKITGDWLAYSIKYSIERAKIEHKLVMRENRLRAILEKSPDGYMVVRQDGCVMFVNQGAELIFGQSRETMLKQAFSLEADTERTIETEILRPDGSRILLEIRAVEIHWDVGLCRLVILRDLNPIRALERNRDEFISMISHELRSPLTVVKESMQIFYDEVVGHVNEKQKEIIKIGLDNAARLNRLIEALLDITKMEAGVTPMDISLADLGTILEETAKEYSLVAAGKKITLTNSRPGAPIRTYCDLEKIRGVLVNLVSNALKFTPADGQVVLSIKALEGDAVICVENSGPGIDPDDMPKLFNKFARLGCKLPSVVKGTGLGLAISKGIVEMHKGSIWAESQPEKGCRFYVRLPFLDFSAAAGEMVRREIQRSGGGKRHFSAVTLHLPKRTHKGWAETVAKAEAFLKTHIRSARILLKNEDGPFTLLIPDTDATRGCKVCSFIERSMAQLGVAEISGEMALTSLLSYPEDFADKDSFTTKMALAAREKIHV